MLYISTAVITPGQAAARTMMTDELDGLDLRPEDQKALNSETPSNCGNVFSTGRRSTGSSWICSTGTRSVIHPRAMSAAWVSVQFRRLQQFFRLLVDIEQEISENPFAKLKAPEGRVRLCGPCTTGRTRAGAAGGHGPRGDRRNTFVVTDGRTVRLLGISILDLDQCAGPGSRNHNRELVGGKAVKRKAPQ